MPPSSKKQFVFGHLKAYSFRNNRIVYSFCCRRFFAAIGDEDNRNRRLHEVQTIQRRLMSLDYVLSKPDYKFLATEKEKLEFFEHRGLTPECLPVKRYQSKAGGSVTQRFFVDKLPLGIPPDRKFIGFCYVDSGQHSAGGFESFLTEYRPLLSALPAIRITYFGCSNMHFESAKRLFNRMLPGGTVPQSTNANSALVTYFSARLAFESRDLKAFDQERLIRYREDRKRFSGAYNDELFECWKQSGIDAIQETFTDDFGCRFEFETRVAPSRYELFGTLAKEALQ